MHPSRFALLLSWLLLAATAAFAQQNPEVLYDDALQQFRSNAFAEAVRLFEQFRSIAPKNDKADDALYYIGRALAGLGQPGEAASRFEQVRALGPEGNRYVEATTELARLRLDAGDPAAAAALLEPLKKTKNLDVEDRRALRLLAGARVELGRADWKAHRDEQARQTFAEAVAHLEFLLREPAGDRELLGLLEELARAEERLIEAAPDKAAYETHRQAALSALDRALALDPAEPKRGRLRKLRDAAAAPARAALQGKVEGLGGAAYAAIERPSASSLWLPGAQASGELALVLPLGWQQQLTLSAALAHDDWGLRTFNFAGSETGAGRILQRTEDFGAALSWEAGSSRGLRSLLKLSGGYRLAEDDELNALDLKTSEKLDWRAGPAWKLELDGSFAYSVYPGYATGSGRELDHLLTSIKPQATWYPSPDFSLGLGYAFAFKQYLHATYDTPAGPGTATENKQYFTHTADLTLQATPGKIFHPTLSYSFAYNETRNYDVELTVTGNPFVRDYYDFLEHALDLGLRCKWSPDFRTDLNARAALQNFLNYPSQNAGGTDLTGEKRRDLNLAVDAEVSYRIWKKERNRFGDLSALLRLAYEQNISNTYQEASFQTNYTVAAVTAGLSMELK
jgi:hypothetical protein